MTKVKGFEGVCSLWEVMSFVRDWEPWCLKSENNWGKVRLGLRVSWSQPSEKGAKVSKGCGVVVLVRRRFAATVVAKVT